MRRMSKVAAAALAVGALALTGCSASGGGSTSGSTTTVNIATSAWIGYAAWNIAVNEGFDKDEGLKLNLVNLSGGADAALKSGKVDANNTVVGNWMSGKADSDLVLLLDQSRTADAILGGADVKSVSDLKGKTVALDKTSASVFLFDWALQDAGIDPADVKTTQVTPDQAATLLVTKRVDAAVTFEPYVSSTLAEHPEFHEIYTAGKKPGLIADALEVSPQFAKSSPKTVTKLLKVWDKTMKYLASHKTDGQKQIATALGAKYDDLKTAFDGIDYYDLEANKKLFDDGYVDGTMTDVLKIAEQNKLVTSSDAPDLDKRVDLTFLDGALGK